MKQVVKALSKMALHALVEGVNLLIERSYVKTAAIKGSTSILGVGSQIGSKFIASAIVLA